MLFLISLVIAVLVAFCLDKPLKKHPVLFYAAAAVLTVITIITEQSNVTISNSFVRDYVLGVFTRGALGAAFWAVVMWAGALPNGTFAIKKIMPIRGELSITAAILTLSHVITYGIQHISDIIRDRTGSGDAFRSFVITSIVCLVMVLIMIPLTIMSFKTIRKKMDPKTWKKIQRAAYIFYAFIFVHVMVLFIPKAQKGKDGYFLSVIVYSVIFIGYAVMRIRKAYISKKKPEAKAVTNVVCACAMIVPLCIIGFVSRNTGNKETIQATKENPATFIFEAPTDNVDSSDAKTVSVTTTTLNTALTTSSVTSTSGTATGSTETSVTTSTQTTDINNTTETEEAVNEEPQEENAPDENEDPAETPQEHTPEPPKENVQETPPAEEQPSYRFKNGTFEGTGEGYAGSVHVSITIENDFITGFSAYADDDDPDYFSDAMQHVIPQIQRSISADGIDACSGATYSSNGIIEAARDALEKAKN
ncbi:MAG: FMN-binding protein [Ruminococcus sp.]|nr:FMN-binding protein [Ruminococcus sp.]